MRPAPRQPSPTQPWPAATVAALLHPLERPESWWVALAGFLARGGLLLFLLPILVLHTPAGVQTELSPLLRLGPSLTGGLGGLIREEDNRLAIRLSPVVPPDDPTRPWRAPLAIRAALGLEPMRAATLRPNELETQVLAAFRRAVESLGRH